MKTLNPKRSMEHFISELVFTEAALDAMPETSFLAKSCRKLEDEWDDFNKIQKESRFDVLRTTARVRVRAQRMKSLIREFGGVLMVAVNQNREATLYRRFFEISPSRISKLGIRTQIDIIRHRFIPNIEKLGTTHALQPYRDRLRQVVEEAQAALHAQKSAKSARRHTSFDIEEWKNKVNTTRITLLSELLKLASDNGFPRNWADTFFRVDRRKSKGALVEEVETTAENNFAVNSYTDRVNAFAEEEESEPVIHSSDSTTRPSLLN